LGAIAADYSRTVRGLGRDVRLLFLARGLVWLGGVGMFAVLYNLYLLRLGLGPELVGLVNGVALAGEALIALPGSELGRRLSTRVAMIVGLIICILTYSGLAVSWLLPEPIRLGWLITNAFFSSASFAIILVNMTPFLMGATSRQECDHAFSVFSAITTACGFLGALLAGLLPGVVAGALGLTLADPAPYGVSLVVADLFLIPATVVLIAAREPSVHPADEVAVQPDSPGAPFYERAPRLLILLMAIAILVRALGDGTATIFWNVYFDEAMRLPTALIGGISALAQLLAVPAALATPLLALRLGNARAYALATLAAAGCALVLAFAPVWQVAGMAYIALQALLMVALPAVTVFQQSLVSPRRRATMAGAVSMAFTLGLSVTAIGGGYAIRALDYRSVFSLGAVLVAASAALFWAWFVRGRGNAASPSDRSGSCSGGDRCRADGGTAA
jgi:MFS family permease